MCDKGWCCGLRTGSHVAVEHVDSWKEYATECWFFFAHHQGIECYHGNRWILQNGKVSLLSSLWTWCVCNGMLFHWPSHHIQRPPLGNWSHTDIVLTIWWQSHLSLGTSPSGCVERVLSTQTFFGQREWYYARPFQVLFLASVLLTDNCHNKICARWRLCFAGYYLPL